MIVLEIQCNDNRLLRSAIKAKGGVVIDIDTSCSSSTSGTSADSRLVLRKRLFAQLDDLLALGAVHLAGTAGTGKSTLVKTYAQARGLHLLTIRIEPGDMDAFNLLTRVSELLELYGDTNVSDTPTPDPAVAGRRLFDRLFRTLNDRFLLFVDDLEQIPQECVTHTLLVNAVEALPQHGSMVLASREKSPDSFARTQASGMLNTVSEAHLRLTEPEAVDIVRSHARQSLPVASINTIVNLADGWAALCVLLATATTLRIDEKSPSQVPEVVFDYFAREVFSRLSKAEQNDLESVALLPEFSERVALSLTGDSRTAHRFAVLSDRHFFLDRVDQNASASNPDSNLGHTSSNDVSGVRRYRIHSLFKNFLQRRLKISNDAFAYRESSLAAACVLDANNEHEAAIELRLSHKDFDAASVSIRRIAPVLLHQQRHATVLAWMRVMPDKLIEQSAELSLWNGVAAMLQDPVISRKHLDRSYQLLCETDATDSNLRILTCCLAIETWLVHWDNFHGMDQWVERLSELLVSDTPLVSTELEAHVCCAMLNASLFRGEDPDAIKHWHERGSLVIDKKIDPIVYMMLAQALILVPTWTSRFSRSEVALEMLRGTLFNHQQPEPLSELWFRSCEVAICWNRADRPAAEYACARGQLCAEQCGADFSNVLLPYHAGIACLIAGDGDAAITYARQVAANTHSEQLMNVVCHHQLEGMLARHQGRYELAVTHLETAAERALKAGMYFAVAWQYAGLGFVAIEQDDESKARYWFAKTREHSDKLRLTGMELDVRMGEAWLAEISGDKQALHDALSLAFELARKDSRVASVWWTRSMLSDLCGAALEAGIEIEHVLRIIHAHGLHASQEYRHVEAWPWPVKIRLLGKASITINNKNLDTDSKRNAKPIELIYALAALGGEVRADTMADLLWSEAQGDAAMDTLKTTLSRARRKLLVEGALNLVHGRLSLAQDIVWCDVSVVNALAQGTSDKLSGRRQTRERDDIVVSLYAGDLLIEEAFVWVEQPRGRVREQWLRANMRRSEALTLAGEYIAVAKLWEHALDCSPQTEFLYRRAMQAHLDAGSFDAGVLLYERCVLQLSHASDAATKAVHQALRKALLTN